LLIFVEQLHYCFNHLAAQCIDTCSHLSPHSAHIRLAEFQYRIDRGALFFGQGEILLQMIRITLVLTVSRLGWITTPTALAIDVASERTPGRSSYCDASRENA
jgi:hypothetical protein